MTKRSIQVLAATIAALCLGDPAAALIIGTYYEDTASRTCSQPECTTTFAAVPNGKTVTVSRIYCSVSASNNDLVILVFGVEGAARDQPLPFTRQATAGGTKLYYSALDTKRVFSAGSKPLVMAFGATA